MAKSTGLVIGSRLCRQRGGKSQVAPRLLGGCMPMMIEAPNEIKNAGKLGKKR